MEEYSVESPYFPHFLEAPFEFTPPPSVTPSQVPGSAFGLDAPEGYSQIADKLVLQQTHSVLQLYSASLRPQFLQKAMTQFRGSVTDILAVLDFAIDVVLRELFVETRTCLENLGMVVFQRRIDWAGLSAIVIECFLEASEELRRRKERVLECDGTNLSTNWVPQVEEELNTHFSFVFPSVCSQVLSPDNKDVDVLTLFSNVFSVQRRAVIQNPHLEDSVGFAILKESVASFFSNME